MSIEVHRLGAADKRARPAEPYLASASVLMLLAGSCAVASFALACATPFAAFAVVAAALLPLPAALMVVAAAWIVNQAIGFGALGYPIEINTILWGAAIGAAAMIATAASALALRLLAHASRPVAMVLALVSAYAAYEVTLFALSPALGGAGAFTLATIGRLAILNVLWMIGLSVLSVLAKLFFAYRRGRAHPASNAAMTIRPH